MGSATTAKRHRAPHASRWVQPVQGYSISTPFGVKGPLWASGYHTGADFQCPSGTPVHVVTAGRVTSVGPAGAYGNRVCVTHSPGFETWYCHLSSFAVHKGQQLAAGALIGHSGATGNTTGAHLHLEVRVNGVAKDPAPYLSGAADAPDTPTTGDTGTGSVGIGGGQMQPNAALVPSGDSGLGDAITTEVRRLTIIAATVLGGVTLIAVGVARGSNFNGKA